MSVAITSYPPSYAALFSDDDIAYIFDSNVGNYVSYFKLTIVAPNTSPTVGQSFSLEFSDGTSQTFTFAALPSNANELPIKPPALSDSDYVLLLIEQLQNNYFLLQHCNFGTTSTPDPDRLFIYLKNNLKASGIVSNISPWGALLGVSPNASSLDTRILFWLQMLQGALYNNVNNAPFVSAFLNDGTAKINLSDIVKTQLLTSSSVPDILPCNASDGIKAEITARKFRLKYAETGIGQDPQYIQTAESITVILGGTGAYNADVHPSSILSASTPWAWLTHSPQLKPVTPLQPEFVSFVVQTPVPSGSVLIELKITDHNGAVTTSYISMAVLNNVQPGEKLLIPVGISSLGVLTSVPTALYYEVQIVDSQSFTALTTSKKYTVAKHTTKTRYFVFLNSLGGIDTLVCDSDIDMQLETDAQTAYRNGSPLYTQGLHGQLFTYCPSTTFKYQLATVFMAHCDFLWLQELNHATYAAEVRFCDPCGCAATISTCYYVPIVLSQFKSIPRDDIGLAKIQWTYEEAYTHERYPINPCLQPPFQPLCNNQEAVTIQCSASEIAHGNPTTPIGAFSEMLVTFAFADNGNYSDTVAYDEYEWSTDGGVTWDTGYVNSLNADLIVGCYPGDLDTLIFGFDNSASPPTYTVSIAISHQYDALTATILLSITAIVVFPSPIAITTFLNAYNSIIATYGQSAFRLAYSPPPSGYIDYFAWHSQYDDISVDTNNNTITIVHYTQANPIQICTICHATTLAQVDQVANTLAVGTHIVDINLLAFTYIPPTNVITGQPTSQFHYGNNSVLLVKHIIHFDNCPEKIAVYALSNIRNCQCYTLSNVGAGTVTNVTHGCCGNAPQANIDFVNLACEDADITIYPLANDTDPNNNIDTDSITITQQPHEGVAVVNANGSITYTAATPRTQGIFYLQYTVSDTDGNTDLSTVFITVNVCCAISITSINTDACNTSGYYELTITYSANNVLGSLSIGVGNSLFTNIVPTGIFTTHILGTGLLTPVIIYDANDPACYDTASYIAPTCPCASCKQYISNVVVSHPTTSNARNGWVEFQIDPQGSCTAPYTIKEIWVNACQLYNNGFLPGAGQPAPCSNWRNNFATDNAGNPTFVLMPPPANTFRINGLRYDNSGTGNPAGSQYRVLMQDANGCLSEQNFDITYNGLGCYQTIRLKRVYCDNAIPDKHFAELIVQHNRNAGNFKVEVDAIVTIASVPYNVAHYQIVTITKSGVTPGTNVQVRITDNAAPACTSVFNYVAPDCSLPS